VVQEEPGGERVFVLSPWCVSRSPLSQSRTRRCRMNLMLLPRALVLTVYLLSLQLSLTTLLFGDEHCPRLKQQRLWHRIRSLLQSRQCLWCH
jgi:hypothetical protein